MMFSFSCFFLIFIGMVVSFPTFSAAKDSAKADLVIYNGTIHTMNPKIPAARMVAARAGKIVFVGSDETFDDWVGRKTRVIDLEGKTMTPGFIESHGHLISMGYAGMQLDLGAAKNYDELVNMVARAAETTPPGEWILGRGWHQSKWDPPPETMVEGFQTHHALSRAVPDHPVLLVHASGHAGFANAKAMEIAGITPRTVFAGGGEIIRDADGAATGIFTESAQALIRGHIPRTTPAKSRLALEAAIRECIENGLTSFQDASSGREAIDLYRAFLQEGKLNIRLWAMLDGGDGPLLEEWFSRGPEIGSGDDFLTIRAVKLFADGALGSRGAWLLSPYTDRPDHSGDAVIPMTAVYETGRKALKSGFQLCVHAIGDRANREVLDQFERVFAAMPDAARDHRFRIEHAQHLSAIDIPRFAAMNVIAAMQGIHLSSDRPWAINRLGKERILEGAYVWRKLLDKDVVVINGTDAPVEPINPIASFYALVTRKTLGGHPPGGYEPDQKMTRRQALRAYTLDAAYGAFEEHLKGSIEVGKFADFTVFTQDIMTVPDESILETRVACTIINGNVVFER
jgi:predicted amidohydrolase YtcJ